MRLSGRTGAAGRAGRLLAAAALAGAAAAGGGGGGVAAAPPAATIPCDTCHDQPAEWTKKPAVHAPVASAQCLACHNAHASRHGSLLRHAGTKTCAGCHQELAARIGTGNAHGVLASERACLSCHDPHASDRKKLLRDEPGKLCLSCHADVQRAASSPHHHAPASRGDCLTCHDPHAAPRGALAVKDEPALCTACHKPGEPKTSAAHKGIAVASARCTGCHAPHGSELRGMILPRPHFPFAEGSCDACHADPKADPAALRDSSADVCLACHEPRKGGHPVPEKHACVACHTPHASSGPPLIRDREKDVCLSCHAGVAAARASAASFHPVFGASQDCTACHELHTGQTSAYLKKKDALTTCSTCHASHAQFSHPMGPGVADPSHPGRDVTCLSCHDPHGTPYPQFLLADPRQELCVRCHDPDKR